MRRRNWKSYRPTSLRDAIEACLDFAMEKHRRDIERVATLMGLTSKWALYKWVSKGNIPARAITAFEHACGCHYLTAYLGVAAGKLLIDFPTGRVAGAGDINAVQAACTEAVGALLKFAKKKVGADATLETLQHALQLLAHEHANVQRFAQPELTLQ